VILDEMHNLLWNFLVKSIYFIKIHILSVLRNISIYWCTSENYIFNVLVYLVRSLF